MQISGGSNVSQYSAVAQTRQRKLMNEEELLSKADKNGDGKVDQSEMSALIARMGPSETGNGQNTPEGDQQTGPSAEEIAAIFAETDSDGDGLLSLEDFTAFGEKMRANGNQPPGPPPAGAGGPPPGGGASTPESDEEAIASLFNAADTDGDGKVSLEEMIAFQQEMRSNSGSDADNGQLSLDALKQMAQTSVDSLMNALSGDENAASSPLSMADILAELRNADSESDEFTSLIQSIIEKAYQLGQRDSSAGTFMTESTVGPA